MAKPRIFVSSTFYDLRHVRNEIDRFIRDIGYEPVLNEQGHIAYGSKDTLERYCYKEIEKVSMLVSIVGGRFGTPSRGSEQYSISNMEIKTAIDQGKQVYIFVENGVLSEYRTYLKNKDLAIAYHHVDDVRVYKFLEEIYSLPLNNQIIGFDNIPQLILYLKEQWAGLLEIYLAQQSQERIFQLTETIQSTAETLKGLVDLLKAERVGLQSSIEVRQDTIDSLILQNHPFFTRLQRITNTGYRIFFTSIEEMERWLKVKQLKLVDKDEWDHPDTREYISWQRDDIRLIIKIKSALFDEKENLKPMLSGEWSNDMATFERTKIVQSPSNRAPNDDDDIPF